MEQKQAEIVGENPGRIPFKELPNLPKPVFTSIDLGIKRDAISAFQYESFQRFENSNINFLYSLRPGISDSKRVGYFAADHSTQTDQSDIVELKSVTGTITTLIKVGAVKLTVSKELQSLCFCVYRTLANFAGT